MCEECEVSKKGYNALKSKSSDSHGDKSGTKIKVENVVSPANP